MREVGQTAQDSHPSRGGMGGRDGGLLLVRSEPQEACGTADPGQHREAPKATDLHPRQRGSKGIWQKNLRDHLNKWL